MSTAASHPASLSEISHLFLSSLRTRQTGGAPRPKRIPPPKQPSVDLTPEEFEQVIGNDTATAELPVPPVKAVLASHFGAGQLDALQKYAASQASSGRRVGLIVIDAAEFRIQTFESGDGEAHETVEAHRFDERAIRDAINELNCDLDIWLLAVLNPHLPESRNLLRKIKHWTLLTGCDHEAVVSAYRALKSVEDIARPRLSLAAVVPSAPADAEATFRRLAGVASQFLDWPAESEPAVQPSGGVCRCDVIRISLPPDKAQTATGVHWQLVEELLEQAKFAPPAESSAAKPVAAAAPAPQASPRRIPPASSACNDGRLSEPSLPKRSLAQSSTSVSTPVSEPIPAAVAVAIAASERPRIEPELPMSTQVTGPRLADSAPIQDISDVIALTESDRGPEGVLLAVLRNSGGELVECPLRPPMCPAARLAITRDRRVMLLAVAGQGLADLKAIGQAFRWLAENRPLISMALPQFALDTTQMPGLRLLVDHADANAELLQPLFELSTVQIQTYRRLRWGENTGLLLEAA